MSQDEIHLPRREAAKFLTERGLQTSPTTLATLATRGNGPFFSHYGRRAIYKPSDLLAWAQARTKPARGA